MKTEEHRFYQTSSLNKKEARYMTDSGSNGSIQNDSAAIKKHLTEWGLTIDEPTHDEQAEVIASRLKVIEKKRKLNPSHEQQP
jgi:hypothetical protein